MTYSLKLDWTGHRINVVHVVLLMPQVIIGDPHAGRLRQVLHPYVGMEDTDEATLKLDLSRSELDAFELLLSVGMAALAGMILRARDNLPTTYGYAELVAMQTQTWRALRDVQTYRENAAAVPLPYTPER